MADDVTKKIIRDLAKHHPRNKIITEICDVYRLQWIQAERLVDQIEEKHAAEIHNRQRLFYLLLGGALALGGIILSVYMLFAAINGMIFYLLRLPIPYLGNAAFFTLGILVFFGGLRGVIRIWKSQ